MHAFTCLIYTQPIYSIGSFPTLCKFLKELDLQRKLFLRAGITSASGKSSLIKSASATLLTLTMMLQATGAAVGM